jgi:hypothetical protein
MSDKTITLLLGEGNGGKSPFHKPNERVRIMILSFGKGQGSKAPVEKIVTVAELFAPLIIHDGMK